MRNVQKNAVDIFKSNLGKPTNKSKATLKFQNIVSGAKSSKRQQLMQNLANENELTTVNIMKGENDATNATQ